jgi:hypothetical protein
MPASNSSKTVPAWTVWNTTLNSIAWVGKEKNLRTVFLYISVISGVGEVWPPVSSYEENRMRKLMVGKVWISAFLLAALVAGRGDSDKNGNAGNPGAPTTPPTVPGFIALLKVAADEVLRFPRNLGFLFHGKLIVAVHVINERPDTQVTVCTGHMGDTFSL